MSVFKKPPFERKIESPDVYFLTLSKTLKGPKKISVRKFTNVYFLTNRLSESTIIRQITESELKQKVTQCICQPNNFTKQKLKLLVKLTILILTIKKLNFIFYLKKSSYII